MGFRLPLLLLDIALCLLSLHNTDASKAANWPKVEPQLVGFSWTDCGATTDPAHVKSVTVSPDPVKIPGNLTINTSFVITTTTATDLSLAVTMEKKIGNYFRKLPCIDKVGSCTYRDVCKDWAEVCPKYFEKYGLPCTCPFPAKTFTLSDVFVPITQSLPGIASGEFRITASLVSATTGQQTCLQVVVDLRA